MTKKGTGEQQQPPITHEQVNSNQAIETQAYTNVYKVKPEFKDAVLKALGRHSFNEIAQLMQAINVETIDHNALNNLLGVLGRFPYIEIAPVLTNVNNFIEQVVEDEAK